VERYMANTRIFCVFLEKDEYKIQGNNRTKTPRVLLPEDIPLVEDSSLLVCDAVTVGEEFL